MTETQATAAATVTTADALAVAHAHSIALLQELRVAHAKKPSTGAFNLLVLGHKGAGKTQLLSTARRPILIHSFDPGGTKTIRDAAAEGYVIVDSRFEDEDPRHPVAALNWDHEFDRLKAQGVFDHIGTFCIDSLTMMCASIVNKITADRGRPEAKPTWDDYHAEHIMVRRIVMELTKLPCDTIITLHMIVEKDDLSGRIRYVPDVTGKLKGKVPVYFDEYLVLMSQETPSGIERKLLTQNTGMYEASTRLGANGRYELYEEPNIMTLIKKAGLPTEHRPEIPL